MNDRIKNVEPPNPIFLEGVSHGLHIDLGTGNLRELKRYIVGSLRRAPQDLKKHVQYIFALLDNKPSDPEAVFAGLLDLFIVLNSNGLSLRRRLLLLARPHLKDEDYHFFQSHLEAGISIDTPVRVCRQSSFSANISGNSQFISKRNSEESQGFESFYDEALSLLEYGEVDEAKVLLENGLRVYPGDERVASELVVIYQHQKDDASMKVMTEWFIDNGIDLPDCWPLI